MIASIPRVAASPAFAVLLALAPAAQSEPARRDDDRGRAVLASALEKQGGPKALAAIRDFTLEARGTAFGRTVLMTRCVLRGPVLCIREDGRRQVSEAHEERRVLVVRGDRGRIVQETGAATMPPTVVRSSLARYYRSTLGLLEALGTKGVTISHGGTARVGEVDADLVAIGRPGHETVSAAIDAATGRILQATWRPLGRDRSGAPPPAYVARFSDFAPLGDLKAIPRKVVLTANGRRVSDRTTLKVEINRGLKPSDFPVD